MDAQGANSDRDFQSVLGIAIEKQKPGSGIKGKGFAQLLDDPQASGVLGDVEVQNASAFVADDEEAIEYAERDRGNRKEIHRGDGFLVVAKKGKPALARPGSLGARFIQREIVLSETSKPSMRSSPWMRGAPQVGFSATIWKIRPRTSLAIGVLPVGFLTLEINFQYQQNPARCHRTTVSGVTTKSACFHPDQHWRANSQTSLSDKLSLGRG